MVGSKGGKGESRRGGRAGEKMRPRGYGVTKGQSPVGEKGEKKKEKGHRREGEEMTCKAFRT